MSGESASCLSTAPDRDLLIYVPRGFGRTDVRLVIGFAYCRAGICTKDWMKERTKFHGNEYTTNNKIYNLLIVIIIIGITYKYAAHEIGPKNKIMSQRGLINSI